MFLKSINKVLIRVDFNVPIKNGNVLDFTRIKAALPTIKYFLKHNLKIVLISHLGRPVPRDESLSLKIIQPVLTKVLKKEVVFLKKIVADDERVNKLPNGTVILLENLRFYQEEGVNDLSFAEKLASYGDIFVNDAFGVAHRSHASTVGIKKFFVNKAYKGFLLNQELRELEKMKNNPKLPFTVIVGGGKIGSKIHMLKSFLNIADNILIGGGMAFPFIKQMGGKIGKSLCIKDELSVVDDFLTEIERSNTKLILPKDCITTTKISDDGEKNLMDIKKISEGHMGVDIGPETIELFKKTILGSNSIVWNGPMGVSEIDRFSLGTKQIAKTILAKTRLGAYSLIGGGDTISDITRFGFKNQFSYVSTGGGAMLDFFKNHPFTAVENLKNIPE